MVDLCFQLSISSKNKHLSLWNSNVVGYFNCVLYFPSLLARENIQYIVKYPAISCYKYYTLYIHVCMYMHSTHRPL